MASEPDYESILLVKPDINVYRIPPRASNRGYRAADWKLEQPDWVGRLRITARGKVAYIKLEDKVSGELFAQAPVEQYPGITVETVSDSSRYFVIRIQDDNGRSAFIGIGFGDRGDAFDFNVSLQDHFKWVKQESEISKQSLCPDLTPKLDLGFKEGQTITLNIGQTKKKDKPRPQGTGGLGLLPPPPGGRLLDLDGSSSIPTQSLSNPGADLWGEFSSPASSVSTTNPESSSGNWVQF
ncbi:adaptin ear-binding coat-associated protein 1 isoform X2 [Lepisosteus oculatus]|uniref:adaptin ear-binding coat-associated protein 1 isoform X2 n=1 Tax=Lepisosteus oculatus TaxID=7918 RepID=UPI0037138F0A